MEQPLIIFGLLFLIMTLAAKHFMKKEVDKPNCPVDVYDVKSNWLIFKILIAIEIIMIVAGLIVWII